MSKQSKVLKALDKQKEIEGDSEDLQLLYKVYECCKTSSEWATLTRCEHYRYGQMSYETHRFYYPSEVLNKLRNLFS
jgi:hypothetical protein